MGSNLPPSKDTPPPPPLTTYQPEMSVLTSAAHTPLQVYVFANIAYHMNTLPALVQFLNRACFIRVVYTWCKAIDAGYFTTWPGLTSRIVLKHLPKYIDSANGHLRLSHQHIRSTNAQLPLTPPPQPIHQPMMTAATLHTYNLAQENLVCMWPVEVSGQIFKDQTGRLPRVSNRGNRSLMVLYE